MMDPSPSDRKVDGVIIIKAENRDGILLGFGTRKGMIWGQKTELKGNYL